MTGGSFPKLQATFSVTTYLTPPEQGLTAGATPVGPAALETATPAADRPREARHESSSKARS